LRDSTLNDFYASIGGDISGLRGTAVNGFYQAAAAELASALRGDPVQV
jgi:citrate synthase